MLRFVSRSVLATILVLSLACSEDKDQGADRISELESSIPEILEAGHIEGLQIALIDDGELVWEAGFGVTNSQSPSPVTTDTVFEAASLTKPLFAYAVMRLAERGLVDLDQPLVELFPTEEIESLLGNSLDAEGFRSDWLSLITARHVLSHSAGTAHGDGGEVYPLAFEPGTDWKYSADGYRFLQHVVEGVVGSPLDEIIETEVLEPLGMTESSMVWREGYEATMANGHDLYGEPDDFRRRSEPTAAASLYTTAGDYARFVCAVIEGTGLEPETADEMLTTAIDMNDDGSLGWSLGFGTQRDDRGTAFWQWGDYGIFRNYILADRESRDGVVYLTNSFNGLSVCSDLTTASIGRPALGCVELEYQPHDGPFYELLWAAREDGPRAVAERLPILAEAQPEIFTDDRVGGMGQILEGVDMYPEAAAFHRFNLEKHPSSGKMMANLAQAEMLSGNLDAAEDLYLEAASAEQDPLQQSDLEWVLDYIRAMREPVHLNEAVRNAIAGDYGPRHIFHRDGQLFYSRDTTDLEAQSPLRAVSEDTLIIEDVSYFKIRVVFDDAGNPTKLVGLYQWGRTDESPRDR
jgi:CubicO group peptidase (beta-lactamase class C family)